jgi:hypothetical protein
MNRTETKSYPCSILKGVALIQITKRYLVSDQLSQPQLRSTEFSNCNSSMRCGVVATETSPGNFSLKWDDCPAHQAYNKR